MIKICSRTWIYRRVLVNTLLRKHIFPILRGPQDMKLLSQHWCIDPLPNHQHTAWLFSRGPGLSSSNPRLQALYEHWKHNQWQRRWHLSPWKHAQEIPRCLDRLGRSTLPSPPNPLPFSNWVFVRFLELASHPPSRSDWRWTSPAYASHLIFDISVLLTDLGASDINYCDDLCSHYVDWWIAFLRKGLDCCLYLNIPLFQLAFASLKNMLKILGFADSRTSM